MGLTKFVTIGDRQQVADWRPAVFEQQVNFPQRLRQAVPIGGFFGFGQQGIEIHRQLLDRRSDMGGGDFVVGWNAGLVQQWVVASGHIVCFD